jgi:8-oxo-dGTP diphosphatase
MEISQRERRDGVVMVLQRGDRFLIGQRAAHKPAPGYWTQVSGKREPGETLQQTVVREAMEELGCRVEPVAKLQELPSANGKFLLHYWTIKLLEGEPSICNDENTELRWLTVEELAQLQPVFQEDIELLTRLTKEKNERG